MCPHPTALVEIGLTDLPKSGGSYASWFRHPCYILLLRSYIPTTTNVFVLRKCVFISSVILEYMCNNLHVYILFCTDDKKYSCTFFCTLFLEKPSKGRKYYRSRKDSNRFLHAIISPKKLNLKNVHVGYIDYVCYRL